MASLAARKRRLAALLEKRRASAPAFDFEKVCHPKQASLVRALVLRTARYLVALCGRQSGKSHGAVLGALLLARATPDVAVIYVTSTDASVKKMAFGPARKMNRDYAFGAVANLADRTMAFPNGSTVYFIGADSERTIERLRGTPNLILCVIDECGIYDSDDLKKMIEAVTPGLRPLAGALALLGTPSLEGDAGTWYEATRNERFEQHRFSYRDNDRVPTFADADRLIDEELLALGYTREHAYFLREYMCEFVVDKSERVYQVTEINLYDEPEYPDDLSSYVVGGDVGVSDADAVLSLGWKKTSRFVWAGDEEEKSGQDALGFGSMVMRIHAKRRPFKIAVDPAGGGKKTILTVRQLSPGIPIREMQKPEIPIQVRAVNILLQTGRLKIRRGSKLHRQLLRATWKGGVVGSAIDEHGEHSDLVPCLRYAVLEATPYLPPADVEALAIVSPVEAKAAEWQTIVKQAQKAKQKKPLTESLLGSRRFQAGKRPF